MSTPAVLIASAKFRPGEGQAFDAWQARHNTVIGVHQQRRHPALATATGRRFRR